MKSELKELKETYKQLQKEEMETEKKYKKQSQELVSLEEWYRSESLKMGFFGNPLKEEQEEIKYKSQKSSKKDSLEEDVKPNPYSFCVSWLYTY